MPFYPAFHLLIIQTKICMHHADNNSEGALSVQNREIHLEILKKMKKLDRLKKKVILSLLFSVNIVFLSCMLS